MPLSKTGASSQSGEHGPTSRVLAQVAGLLEADDPLSGLSDGLKKVVDTAIGGGEIASGEAYRLAQSTHDDLAPLCRAASILRDRGMGRDVSFSPKVFIPLTRLCRDFCGYCTFRQAPDEAEHLYMTPEEVLAVARAGERLGCTEVLFTLGERPEQRYPEAREWLEGHGYRTTLEYLHDVSRLVLRETSMLPHGNPGTMSRREMEQHKEVNASMGMMIESTSPRLSEVGGPPRVRPQQAAQGACQNGGDSGGVEDCLYHGHPHRHRRDQVGADRVPSGNTGTAQALRSRPGGNCPELSGQARHAHGRTSGPVHRGPPVDGSRYRAWSWVPMSTFRCLQT